MPEVTNKFEQLHPIKEDGSIDDTINLFPKIIANAIKENNGEDTLPIQRELVPDANIDISEVRSQDGKQNLSLNINTLFNNLKNNIMNAVYPVGSIYINTNPNTENTNPSIILGIGTWERLEDVFLWAKPATGSSKEINQISGDNTLPLLSHTHELIMKNDASNSSRDFYTTNTVFEDAAKYLMKENTMSWDDITAREKGTDESLKFAKPKTLFCYAYIQRMHRNVSEGYPVYDPCVASGPGQRDADNHVQTYNEGGGYVLTGWIASAGSQQYTIGKLTDNYTHQHTIDLTKIEAEAPNNSTASTDMREMIRNQAVVMWRRKD